MSIGQTFPDVIVLNDGVVRLVTSDAGSWAYMETNLSKHCDKNDIPYFIQVTDETPYQMKEDGLVVRWPKTGLWAYKERVPEWRKQYPKWQGEIDV